MFPLLLLAASAAAGAPAPASTSASAPPPAPSIAGMASDPAPPVETLVASALARHPSVAALRARLDAAREAVGPARVLDDPMVEAMYQEAAFPSWGVGDTDMSMLGVEVRQDLVRRSKREARAAVAQADATLREAGIEVLRREIARDVRLAYARLYAVDRELENLAAARELLDLIRETTAARYAVGDADQQALIKAQLMRTRLEARAAELAGTRRVVVAALARLVNDPALRALGPVAALEAPPFPEGSWDAGAAEASAELAARRAAIEAAARRAEAARVELRPDYTAATGAYYRGSLDPVVTLKFGFRPQWRRRQKQEPLIRSAERELEAERRELEAEKSRLEESVARLAAAREQAEAQVRLYREGIVPQSSASFGAARSAYLAGRGSFAALAEDFALWLEARTELARQESAVFSTWAELQALLGEEGGR